ncbi:MAG TPA: DUF3467 domain-containing protein [Bryobacteraceae bacterium]|nr:DUF3467 domain-containing protein [Bryobacteraceae bacterium]
MEEPTLTNVEYVEPDDGRLIVYANNVMWGVTSYDVRLLFGELLEIDPKENKAVIEQRVQVTMSWLQAKQLLEILQGKIAAYEAKNGVIDTKMVPY